jgi:hypothetical protein
MHLPVGVSDFRKLIEYKDPLGKGYLYVDKTNFIKEIIYDLSEVIVFTRPRRFGKTLNLSMLQHFFSAYVNGASTKELFTGLNINQDPTCLQQQGQYPVIFISFKDIKQPNFEFCIEKIGSVIAATYRKYEKELSSDKMSNHDKIYIKSILDQNISQVNLESSIKRLLELLFKYYNIKPILLIDEYDTPIQEAYLRGYYDQLIPFFKNFLSEPLKDENLLKRAVLTGILRVSKESLFSGLNNVKIYSILNKKYSNYFGFTENETNKLINTAKLATNLTQTKEWYNGYNFAGETIYNPYSIIEFIKEEGRLRAYWINTSSNELIKSLIINSSNNIKTSIESLIAGHTVREYVDEHVIFSDIKNNPGALWSLLLMSGYLKYTSYEDQDRGYICDLCLPNNEIESFYISVIREWISGDRGFVWYQDFLNNLAEGKVEEFASKLQILIDETLSFRDVTKKSQESFYHGLMLAFVSGLKDTHFISSNKESGQGLYDVAIIPKDCNKLGIIMEFKAIHNELKLEKAAKEALLQIKTSKYFIELKSKGINSICLMGISFSKKAIQIVSENFKIN